MRNKGLYGGQVERFLNGRYVAEPFTFDRRTVGEYDREAQVQPLGRSGRGNRTCNACTRSFGDVIGLVSEVVVECERTHATLRRQVDRLPDVEVAQAQLHGVIARHKAGGRRGIRKTERKVVHQRLLVAEHALHAGLLRCSGDGYLDAVAALVARDERSGIGCAQTAAAAPGVE